jgi:hypothetical protein
VVDQPLSLVGIQAICRKAPFVRMTFDDGSLNLQEGRKEIVGCIQHKDWRRCAIGALGVFLFYRYEVLREPFPDTRWRLPKDPDWAPFEGTNQEIRGAPAARSPLSGRPKGGTLSRAKG